VFDGEPDASRRTVRPLLHGFRLPNNGALIYPLESITANELIQLMSGRHPGNLDRAPAD